MLLDAVLGVLATISNQAHGQLVGLEENLVRVLGLLIHRLTERLEGILGNHSGVGKPLAVRLDPGVGDVSRLVGSSNGDITIGIPLRPSLLVHAQGLDLLRIAVVVG